MCSKGDLQRSSAVGGVGHVIDLVEERGQVDDDTVADDAGCGTNNEERVLSARGASTAERCGGTGEGEWRDIESTCVGRACAVRGEGMRWEAVEEGLLVWGLTRPEGRR